MTFKLIWRQVTNNLPFLLNVDLAQKCASSCWILLTQEIRLNSLDDFPEMSADPLGELLSQNGLFEKSCTSLQEFPIRWCWCTVHFFCLLLWVFAVCKPWFHRLCQCVYYVAPFLFPVWMTERRRNKWKVWVRHFWNKRSEKHFQSI